MKEISVDRKNGWKENMSKIESIIKEGHGKDIVLPMDQQRNINLEIFPPLETKDDTI